MEQLIKPSAGHQPQLELTNTNVHFIMVCMEQLRFNNRHILLVSSALQYTLPRMKQANNEVSEDLPLFVD